MGASVWVPVRAQTEIGFSLNPPVYTFGEQITFTARVQPADAVSEIYLFIQPTGEATRLEKVQPDAQGNIQFIYNVKEHYLRPFTRVFFWYRVVSVQGDKKDSVKSQFDYIDNRQDWQSLDDANLKVYWRKGDLFFGQSALNSAKAGMRAAMNLLPDHNLTSLQVYIYDNADAMQEILTTDSSPWAAGVSNPDLNVIIVTIEPGVDQQLEMDRQIPHEIAHIQLYQIVKESYSKVPEWLNEGLASAAETYPNSDYQRTLKKAAKDNSLMPIESLCAAFPEDAAGAFQAYAESASFVQFLQNKFGSKGLLDLIDRYKSSYSCTDGVQAATGSSLSQLDYRWRQETLGVDTGSLAVQNLLPYLLIAVLLLGIPFLVGLVWARHSSGT